jgi:hypothetical protein
MKKAAFSGSEKTKPVKPNSLRTDITVLKARLTEYNLKKQSQFAGVVIDATQAITMVYGDLGG